MVSTGTLIGSYVITRHLASGGMGVVYEARHQRMPRRAAVKVLHVESAHNPTAVARFKNEATAASLVEHPHVVHLFESGELPGGLPYLIMNFLPGMTLAAFLQQLRDLGGRPELATVLDIGAQMACALAAVHRVGLVHRDVKPGNIILVSLSASAPGRSKTERWHTVLIDFSVAKLPENLMPEVQPLTRPGQWIGTEAYMAPEQARDGALVDGRADVYSLGIVLYEMLAGMLPAGTPALTDAPSSIKVVPAVSEPEEELTALIEQMLSDSPEARPAAEHVEQILGRLAAESRHAIPSSSGPAPPTADEPRSLSSRHNLALRISIGVILGLIGAVTWLSSNLWRKADKQTMLAPLAVTQNPSASMGGRHWRQIAVPGGLKDNLSGIWGSAHDDIWSVGRQYGTLLHHNGREWQPLPGGAARANPMLYGIWGLGSHDIWAVGGKGVILHYNGVWEDHPGLTSDDLLAIGGSSAQDILAVGRGVILHYNGKGWTPVDFREPHSLHGVWYAAPDDAWIVGYNDINQGITLRWDGKQARVVSRNSMRMRDIWGDSHGVVWAVATGAAGKGNILRWDGEVWQIVRQVPGWLTAIWGLGPEDIWAVGEDGLLVHFDGEQWTQSKDDIPKVTYRGIWGTRDDLWAVGESGTVLHWREWSPEPFASGTTDNLNDIWGASESTIWAVGSSGSLLHYDGTSWTPWPSATSRNLNSVHGCSADDVWIVGDGGVSLHFDGKAWSELGTGIVERLESVYCSGKVAWAVGAHGTILTYQDRGWRRVESGMNTELRAVFSSRDDDLWIVGRGGVILRIKGGTPQKLPSNVSTDLWRVWGSDPDNVWIAADDGSLLHHQNGVMQPPIRPIASAIRALSGTSPNDIWAAGNGGTLLHFDGRAWSNRRSGTTQAITGSWSLRPGSVFLVGERGGIWH